MNLTGYYDYLRLKKTGQYKYRDEGNTYRDQKDSLEVLIASLTPVREADTARNHRDIGAEESFQEINQSDNYNMDFDELEFVTKIRIALSLIKQ